MGNKFLFIILFVVSAQVFELGNAQAQTLAQKQAACKKKVQNSHGEGCMSKEAYDRGDCVIDFQYCNNKKSNGAVDPTECSRNGGEWVSGSCRAKYIALEPVIITSKSTKVICEETHGVWNETAKSCSLNGVVCPKGTDFKSCLNNAKWAVDACEEGADPAKRGKWDTVNNKCILPDNKSANTTALSCGNYAKETSCPSNDTTPHLHCVCNFADVDGQAPKTFSGAVQSDLEKIKCPSSAPVATEEAETADKAPATGLACIQTIREKINACKEASTKSVKSCDMKSDTNAETRQQLSNLAQMSQQLVHAGTAEQCKNMGLVTGAAGYGLSTMEKNCNNEMVQCRDACSEVSQYTNFTKIVDACEGVLPKDQDTLEKEAHELASVMKAAKNECLTQTEALLQQVGGALKSATTGYASAAQCENQVSSQPVLTNMSLTSCISNPNAAGCPVNCATNPTNAQCTCLTNPTAAGCQGGAGSQMAGGNPNGTNLPALAAGGLGSKLGSSGIGGSSDLGDLSGLDGSEAAANAGGGAGAEAAAGGMFNQAGVANAGGGAGTEGSAGKAKNGKGGEGAAEEHSLFGGMFQNLKNAAGSLFGSGSGGSSSTSKKSSSVTGGANSAGLKPVVGNKALRGIASNGKSCFVDAKGTEFCFGKKNMDIFKMMNAQYNNQYNTLIIDK